MAALQALLRDLERALEAEREADALAVRRSIAEQYADTPEGAEAAYKVGLALLFRSADLDGAAEAFRAAAKAKQRTWSLCARVSLGTVLSRQGKHQQALFELRRAASAKPRNLLVAQAAGMVVLALREQGAAKDLSRAKGQYAEILEELMKRDDAETAAIARLMRGMEHKLDGEPIPAKRLLEAALATEALPEAERRSAEDALASL